MQYLNFTIIKINNIHIIVLTALIIVIRNILSLNIFKYSIRASGSKYFIDKRNQFIYKGD